MSESNNLQNLELVVGDQVDLTCTNDVAAQDAICSIVDSNFNEISPLSSVLDGPGTTLIITLTSAHTNSIRSKGTLLQIAWDYGGGVIKNTRCNLVGVAI